ncbi:MAG: pilus assembly protein PilP [Ketobacteraceae bacterium]|nr:pilus assembly protein PilP [Ketobacteraceae bacterium]
MKLLSVTLCILAVVLGAGCASDGEFADLRAQMEEIKKRPKGRIEPPPEFKSYKTFSYSAAALRSPFSPPVEVETVAIAAKRSNVKPDLNRPQEPLEQYGIDSLDMVGTLRRPEQTLFALVKDPDGGLHRVREGNYIGRNHGKIVNVKPTKIDVIEIVSDGQEGWIERPRTIVLSEQE